MEVSGRCERYLATRTKLAHLPFQRSIEQFDFDFQPSVDERQARELANLPSSLEPPTSCCSALPGVGKTLPSHRLGAQVDRAWPRSPISSAPTT